MMMSLRSFPILFIATYTEAEKIFEECSADITPIQYHNTILEDYYLIFQKAILVITGIGPYATYLTLSRGKDLFQQETACPPQAWLNIGIAGRILPSNMTHSVPIQYTWHLPRSVSFLEWHPIRGFYPSKNRVVAISHKDTNASLSCDLFTSPLPIYQGYALSPYLKNNTIGLIDMEAYAIAHEASLYHATICIEKIISDECKATSSQTIRSMMPLFSQQIVTRALEWIFQ